MRGPSRSPAAGQLRGIDLNLLCALIARLRREAPGVDLRLRAAADDSYAGLRDGTVDLVVAPMTDSPPGLYCQPLLQDRFVCMVRAGHPTVGDTLTLDEYASLPHLLIAPRGRPQAHVDDALARHGRRRRIALSVPHFLTAPFALAESDLVLTMAERIARICARITKVRVVLPPIDIGGFTFHQIWHERHQQDPGHRWLRGVLREVAGALPSPALPRGARPARS